MRVCFEQRGRAGLEIEQVFEQSTVTTSFATSPMKLLIPRARGQCVCTYVSNFGGGLVAGDQTELNVRVGRNARCFLGSQASTKVYRNPGSLPCGHLTEATVEADGLLVFAPSPVQPFAQSSYHQRQQFSLAPGAGLVLLDWFTSGRPACGERWAFSHFSTRTEVRRQSPNPDAAKLESDLLFLDACRLDQSDGPVGVAYRTGRFDCFATLLLAGPLLREAARHLLGEVSSLKTVARAGLLASASPLQEGAVLRVAGQEVAEVEQCLHRHLAPLANCLGDDPWSRRI